MNIDPAPLSARNQNRSTVVSQKGMVCTSHPLATMAGIDTLKEGGNAIDAAICANAALCVVEPMSCGMGGDLFAIVWMEKEKKLYGLNASGRAPFNWSIKAARAMGLKAIPSTGPLSWSVPGCVSGWDALGKRFGKLTMARWLEPAMVFAGEGFCVSPLVTRAWKALEAGSGPTLKSVFYPNGKAPSFGQVFKNPDMEKSLRIIARGGAEAFYQGEIAERMVRFSNENGGHFSMDDFKDHTVSWVEPVSTGYRGYDIWELPPNGQGIAALQILNIMEAFDVSALKPNSAAYLHLLIEAKKLAFEDRAVYYADMDFADVPVKELISKAYAEKRAATIDPEHASQTVRAGRLKGASDTVYLTAADHHGNMVSLIQSIYQGFGSKMVPGNLGFVLQNRGSLFSLKENDLNRLEPHKRPFNTIIPGFVTQKDRPVFSFGVMGGDFQPQGHAQILMNIIDFGMSVQQAGELPRIEHYESSTPTGNRMTGAGCVGFERGIQDSVKTRLAEMGHKLSPDTGAFGGYQGIWRKESPMRYFGGSDPRKDGCAIGY
jgi:gamma-glutamyltranspeptidase/glutathione hydrolase